MYPFYVAILPIGSFKSEYLGRICDLCSRLKLKVRLMKLDRGFYSGEVIIQTEKPIVIEKFNKIEELGRFVLVNDYDIIAGGIIVSNL